MNKPLKLSTLLFAGWFALSIGVTDVSAEEEAEETDADAEEETEDDAEEDSDEAEDEAAEEERLFDVPSEEDRLLFLPRLIPDRFTYDSGIEIEYPQDGVRGVYSTAYSAGGDRFETLVDLLDRTELNSMVIDIKDDHGNITIDTDSEDERIQNNSQAIISDVDGMMETLEDSEIYRLHGLLFLKTAYLVKVNLNFPIPSQMAQCGKTMAMCLLVHSLKKFGSIMLK
ncbi:predicted glycoside hydrolase [Geomicrobium sp. JCM 19037]|nr:predicted glycoside hydrolase [Geomicrobium sp. JCM 19037]